MMWNAGKWKLPILAVMHKKHLRFNTIKMRVRGISSQMLAYNLKQMEREGIVIRDNQYHLTPTGKRIAYHCHEILLALDALKN